MRYTVTKRIYKDVETIVSSKDFPSITFANEYIRKEIQSIMYSYFTDDSMIVSISRGYGMVKASGIKWLWSCEPLN